MGSIEYFVTEWEEFANSLTTNLTSFFREAHHFPVLAAHLRAVRGKHPITLWCSAASSGEEPYTMAMTVLDTLGRDASQVSILATDLDTKVLATAKAGVYPEERISKLPEDVVKRFFQRGTGDQLPGYGGSRGCCKPVAGTRHD